MRKYILILLMMCLSVMAMAQRAWTVETVPNTRLQSNDIHVSDPDDYLSDSTEMTINTTLCAIRDKADVFVVTLYSIGDTDTKHFATELLNYWGIGDAETNNGVLLLFVEDQHALEMETGYGVEETLTDAKCERIFTNDMAPYFRAGDYEAGLCSGVAEIVTVFGGEIPMGLKTTLPDMEDNTEEEGGLPDGVTPIFIFFALFMALMPILGIIFWAVKSKTKKPVAETSKLSQEDGVTYVDGFKTSWSGSPWDGRGCLGGLMIGMSIFVLLFVLIFVMNLFLTNFSGNEFRYYNWISVGTLILYLTWICFRHNHRVLKTAKMLSASSINPKSVYEAANNHTANKVAMWIAPWIGWIYYLILKKKVEQSNECCCPNCGDMMQKYSTFNLPENHAAENKAEAMKFTPYRCANGHVIVVKEHGRLYDKFSTCSKCGAFTLKHLNTETVRAATYSASGEEKRTYECQHCGDIVTKTVAIPKLVHYTSSGGGSYSSGSSSGRSYSSHSSSHSSGSFGGGRSGGGGHSGRW